MVDRSTIAKLVMGAMAILALAAFCGITLREPIMAGGAIFMDRFGLAGLLLGVVFTDSSIVPLTNEPLVLLALSGGVGPWLTFFVTAAGSVLAGPVGWAGGRLVMRNTSLGPWLRDRNPRIVDLLARYGARFVAVAALLPFPFALATWMAGAANVPLLHVAIASLCRIPKTAFYVGLLIGGWSLGS